MQLLYLAADAALQPKSPMESRGDLVSKAGSKPKSHACIAKLQLWLK